MQTMDLPHCDTPHQAEELLEKLKQRFAECGLQLHPDKTKIVYCKDSNRKAKYQNTSFDFLGFTYRPREAMNKQHNLRFVSFTPAASKKAMKLMRAKIKKCRFGRRTELELKDIADISNTVLRGWINYFGQYYGSELDSVFRHFNQTLVKWAMRKYKSLRGKKTKTIAFLNKLAKEKPKLFAHWSLGRPGAFA